MYTSLRTVHVFEYNYGRPACGALLRLPALSAALLFQRHGRRRDYAGGSAAQVRRTACLHVTLVAKSSSSLLPTTILAQTPLRRLVTRR